MRQLPKSKRATWSNLSNEDLILRALDQLATEFRAHNQSVRTFVVPSTNTTISDTQRPSTRVIVEADRTAVELTISKNFNLMARRGTLLTEPLFNTVPREFVTRARWRYLKNAPIPVPQIKVYA